MADLEGIGLEQPSLDRTPEEKLEAIITFLTEAHLEMVGGYPFDYSENIAKGKVVIAGYDHSKDPYMKTELQVYRKRDLLKWYDEAVRFLKEEEEEDFITALHETHAEEWKP